MLAAHGPKPYELIGFGAIHGPKPYEFIGFGAIHGPKPYEFIGFGAVALEATAESCRPPDAPTVRQELVVPMDNGTASVHSRPHRATSFLSCRKTLGVLSIPIDRQKHAF